LRVLKIKLKFELGPIAIGPIAIVDSDFYVVL